VLNTYDFRDRADNLHASISARGDDLGSGLTGRLLGHATLDYVPFAGPGTKKDNRIDLDIGGFMTARALRRAELQATAGVVSDDLLAIRRLNFYSGLNIHFDNRVKAGVKFNFGALGNRFSFDHSNLGSFFSLGLGFLF
jgi:hypothetical protein